MQMTGVAVRRLGCLAAAIGFLTTATSHAAVPKESTTPLSQKEFFRPDLYISTSAVPLSDLLARMPNRAAWDSFLQERAGSALGRGTAAHIDPRSGAAASIVGVFPLIPGPGYGNAVTLANVSARLGRSVSAVDSTVVAEVVRDFVESHAEVLGVDVTQLGAARATLSNADLWHVRIPQVYRGVPVRHGQLVAAISHGNLVVIGTEGWGNARLDMTPRFTGEQAMDAGFVHIDGRQPEDTILARPALEVIPYAPADFQQGEGFAGPVGAGYGHRLAWVFRFQRAPEHELWEVIVDARSGEVLALEDKNHYIDKQAVGGVYPLTNTGICPTPETCGTMQTGWPMPWLNTGLPAPNNFANSAGVFDYTAGTATSTLVGRFVRINDNCGAISLSSATGDLNFGGTNGQHDCTTPGFGGAGNTAATRSAFYEVNKIKELARGWLPANTWLTGVLQTNVNIVSTCNAFYSGGTINFYRSGCSSATSCCRNTGEIAAVFDHEWGHGMDDFDTGGVLSASSEGYADIAGIYRLQASCVGHGFNDTTGATTCGITVDGTGRNRNENQVGGFHCNTDCSGVRDADWAKHTPNTPDTAQNFVCTQCTTSGTGLCGRQTHCAGAPSRQMAWDLVTRDLVAPPFNMSTETAFIVGNKVFYQGSGLIGSWHTCTCPTTSNGCGATNAYLQWLAADDDNGNLNDGTPHMTAIFAAMDRHSMSCATPAPTNSGCAAGPSGAATLSAVAGNNQVTLNWTAVAGATRYWVFRTEGHNGCNLGKALIAEVTGLTYTDTQVANGRPYSYNVVAAGASSACFGPASNCTTVTPASAPTFSMSCTTTSFTLSAGGQGNTNCTVQSVAGFSGPVVPSCSGLPAGVQCDFIPTQVTPPPNGTADFTLTVSVFPAAPGGTHTFQLEGVSSVGTRTVDMTLTVLVAAVAPAGLVVDAAGNSVLQPNETVVVTPSWRNTGDLPISLSGATSGFTGPAGPVYTNPDSTASYGNLGLAATANCGTTGDCYSVLATAATRPASHWDSTILETMTPTSATKTWTLHIGDSFTDVLASSPFYRFVETIVHKNVTGGCTSTTYCPANSTTREQMAVFVLVSKEPAGYSPAACGATPMFADVPASSPFCRWVEELARRGVVSGCGGGNYCPASTATREQMAVFVLRTLDPALNPPNCGIPMFADVPAISPFCKWIEELARRAVVTGCGGGLYCPAADVSREQMSVFLAVTFGLSLYGL